MKTPMQLIAWEFLRPRPVNCTSRRDKYPRGTCVTCTVSSALLSLQKYFAALRKSNFLISANRELFDSCSNVFIQPPLRCNPVIGIVFVHCCNFIVFCLDKRSHMERSAFIFGIDTNNCNNQIIYNFDSLNDTIPFSWVLTIRNNIFIYRSIG